MKILPGSYSSSVRLLLFVAGFAAALTVRAAEPVHKLAMALQPFVDDHTLPGAVVLVADRNNILALEAVGYADVATKEPMRTDALFWIASMTKSITSTLLMMLVDEGKVNVDDAVEKYLPEFKGVQVAVKKEEKQDKDHPLADTPPRIQGFMIQDEELDKDGVVLKKPDHLVTVRNLLTHMSGISPVKLPRQLTDKDYVTLREAVEGYAKTPFKSEPGSKYEYSNHGIDTVGRIIEVVSGMRYEDFMEQRLLKPLGMKDTTFWPSDEQFKRLAKAYDAPDLNKEDFKAHGLKEAGAIGFFHYPLRDRKRQPWPSGGLFSTATDLSLFCRMLLNGGTYEGHRYVSPESLQQMASTQTGDLLNKGKNEDGYGFGWQTVSKLHKTGTGLPGPFGHGGAYGTLMWVETGRSQVRIFMVQLEGGLMGESGKKINAAFSKAVQEGFPRIPDPKNPQPE